MRRRSIVRPLAAVAVAFLTVTAVALPAQAKTGKSAPEVITITHAVVTPTTVSGSGVGAVRYFNAPIQVKGVSGGTSYLAGSLTTLSIGLPGAHELRGSNLTFVVSAEKNQLVVGGVSLYSTDASTISTGSTTTRPVIGGSGTYAGARGWVVTTNLGDQGWRHVFHVWIGK